MTLNSAIYTNNVVVIRNSEKHNYSYYKQNYKFVPVITCPAFNCGKTMTPSEYDNKVYDIMIRKLDMIFRLAYYNKHDSIVLGAFGCGAYQNPSIKIAEICKKLCEKYSHCFKTIVFAILTDNNDIENARKYNARTNYETFSWVFNVNNKT
jgi:uncharacterized protein (TIGR02452 family)